MNDDNDRYFRLNTPEEIAAQCAAGREEARRDAEERERRRVARMPWLCRWLRGLTGDGAP